MLNTIYKTIAISTLMASSVCIAAEAETTQSSSTQQNLLKIFNKETLLVNARAEQPEAVKDPLQGFNRGIYTFNNAIDRNILRPAAVVYVRTIPEPTQGAYTNFRNNLKEPWNAVNQLLQGKPIQSAKSLGRFTINTLTSLGFADPAKRLDLIHENESFGTTLGVWGVPSGPYIVLPFLGSSSLRDGIGLVPDGFARPHSYIFEQEELLWSNVALEATATRALYLSVDSMIQGDKYAAIRDVYLQQRAFEIAQKRGEDISQSMFSDDSFDDEDLNDELNDELDEENVDPEPETTQ